MQDKLPEEEVLRCLDTDESTGLTEEEAVRRLKVYGPNLVVDHPQVAPFFTISGQCCAGCVNWVSAPAMGNCGEGGRSVGWRRLESVSGPGETPDLF